MGDILRNMHIRTCIRQQTNAHVQTYIHDIYLGREACRQTDTHVLRVTHSHKYTDTSLDGEGAE